MTVDVDKRLDPLCKWLETELKAELERQGHIATGALRESIRVAVSKTAGGAIIEGRGSKIAKYVDWGRKPGGRRVPIDALMGWIEVKGFATGDKAKSLAYAIQYSIWKNGIPTNKDQSKTAFVTRTLTGGKDKIMTDINAATKEFYTIELNNIIRDINEKVLWHSQ